MTSNRLTYLVFYFCIIVSLMLPLFYYFDLPDQVVFHFNTSGKADEWMNKTSFFIFNYALVLFIAVIFLVINYMLKRAPHLMINFSNKEYWLAPERKEESLNVFREFLLWSCSSTLVFINLLMQRSYSTSIQGDFEMGWELWFYIGLFMAAELFLVIKLVIYFNSKKT